jgi:hypothetical protein
MANSGTVSAGSVALASQYNNLRADVLSPTTGHAHNGTTDGGNQIEGTALHSTGATVGYVLTAGAGGTTTTWSPSSVGVYSLATATYTGFAATAATTLYTNGLMGGTAGAILAIAGGGTRFYQMDNSSTSTGNQTLRYWNLNTAATGGSASIAPTVAGTVTIQRQISGAGFDTATSAVVYKERIAATTTGNVTITMRRYNDTLTTNTWNTTILNGVLPAIDTSFTKGPFQDGIFWDATMKIWWGVSSVNTSGATASIYVINDTTGTLYTVAAYPATTAGTINNAVLVPPATAGGTGYLYAYQSSAAVNGWATYAVTSSSIAAVGTTATFPTSDQTPEDAFLYNPVNSTVWYAGQNTPAIFNTSFGTVQANTAGDDLSGFTAAQPGKYDPIRGLAVEQIINSATVGTAYIYKLPNYDAGGTHVYTNLGTAIVRKGKNQWLMGAGSATYNLYIDDSSGSATTKELPGLGTAVFTSATTGRLFTGVTGSIGGGNIVQTRVPTTTVGGAAYLGAGSAVAYVGDVGGTTTVTTPVISLS